METMIRKIEGRYLTFSLAGGEYGVEIQKVREILEASAVKSLPKTPATVAGVLRLRDRAVPVLNLKACLGLDVAGPGEACCILTVVVRGWNGPLLMGLLVDGVREVIQVGSNDLEGGTGMEEGSGRDFLQGRVKYQDRRVQLLDVDGLAEKEAVENLNLTLGGSHEVF
jgi:purine-binding chemotaxis protein CheW